MFNFVKRTNVLRRISVCLTITGLLFNCLSTPASAAVDVTRRVVFPKGKKSVSYKGKLPRYYADYDAYVFRAKKDQTISVKLTTDEPGASISIYETRELGPMEDCILASSRDWSGKLPITSEYSVQVYGSSSIDHESSRGAYTISIELN
jgi:hypothetical protein